MQSRTYGSPPVVQGWSPLLLHWKFHALNICTANWTISTNASPSPHSATLYSSTLPTWYFLTGFAFRGATLDWMGLVELKCLTHLAFNGRAIIPVCVGLLAALRSLCALLVLRWPMTHLRLLADISYYQVVAADLRFAMTEVGGGYRNDWQMGALTGPDYSARADEFIAKRLSGEIARDQYYLPPE
ncbi:hypothetical protein DFH09DRAFT_1117206 [Mycena vulgaris]|nr:hypothetical protein DFH09DRAFT_1117206 [Mycena vulgaris]